MSSQLEFISNDKYSCIPTSQVYRRVGTIPLPKELKTKFIMLIHKWSRESSIPWTVGRLKDFKYCVTQSWAHGTLSHKPEWFATTPSGNLKGLPGSLYRISQTSSANLKAVLMLCNIYSIWTRKSVDLELEEEIVQSIQSPAIFGRNSKNYGRHNRNLETSQVTTALTKLGLARKQRVKPPIPLLQSLPGKLSHVLRIPDDYLDIKNSKYFFSFGDLVVKAFGARPTALDQSPPLDEVGSIHITHEPGLKTRYFAAPNVLLQRALEPLKDSLAAVVKKVPWDCTYNQRKADCAIQSSLSSGRMVYSVDLSKATDHFPWCFQRRVLGSILCTNKQKMAKDSVRLFTDIVETGNWEAPLPSYLRVEWDDGVDLSNPPSVFHRRTVQWKKGQPLGLAPSFFLFTLSHGILLYILNGCKWDEQFWVLGDDVVIMNQDLHTKYRAWLDKYEVPVSEAKSFASSRFAQFAGVTFTNKVSFWIPDWLELTRDTILDAQAWWYPGLTQGFKDDALIRTILALPEPYGLGWNPSGKTLDERFPQEIVDEIVQRESNRMTRPRPRNTVVSLSRVYNALRHAKREPSHYYHLFRDLDLMEPVRYQRSTRSFLKEHLAHLYDGTDVLGYPYQRFSLTRTDPYTLGRLDVWKRTFRAISRETSE